MSESANNELDISRAKILDTNRVASDLDIQLKDGQFLLNPGHAKEIYKLGILNNRNLYKIGEEEKYNNVWGVLDLNRVMASQIFKRSPGLVLGKIVEFTGEQLRQTDPQTDRDNLDLIRQRMSYPNISDEKKRQIGEYVLRKEKELDRREKYLIHQASSVSDFFNHLAQTGRDITQIHKYDSTMADVNRILGKKI